MGAVETARDALFGNPPSATKEPSREGILAAFAEIQTAVTAAANDAVAYPTVASLPAVTGSNNGTRARVYADPTPANNTYWIVKGGAWVVDADYIAAISDAVQPLVDDAVDASEIAVQSSLASLRSMGNSGGDVVSTFGSSALNSSSTGAGAWSTGIPIARDGVVDKVTARVSADMVGDILLVDGPTRVVLAKATAVNFTSGVDVTDYPFGVSVAPAGSLVFISRTSGGFIRTGASGDCITVAASSYAVGATLPAYTIVAVAAVAIEVSVQTSLSPIAQRVAKYDDGRIDRLVAGPRGDTVRSRTRSVMLASAGAASGGFFAKRYYGEGVLTAVDIPMLGASTGFIELWRVFDGVPTKMHQLSVQLVNGANNITIPRWLLRGDSYIRYAPVTGANVTYANGGIYYAFTETHYAIGATAPVTYASGLSIRIGLTVESAAGASPASLSAKRATLDRQLFDGTTVPGDWTVAAPFSVNNGLLASGSGGWDKFAGFNHASSLHQRRLAARVEITTTTSIFGIATQTQGGVVVGGAIAMIDGTAGALRLYAWEGNSNPGVLGQGTAFAAALVSGREYTLVVEINGLSITAVLTDTVTGTQTTVTDTMGWAGPTARFHGRPGFVHRSGSWRADWTNFEIDAPRGQPVLIYGDSNTELAPTGASWAHQIVTALGAGMISARSGEASEDMARRLTDLAALRPAMAIAAHGTNENIIISGNAFAQATWRSNIGDFVDACRDVNCEPILVRPLPQPGKQALMTLIDGDIEANYFGKLRSIDFLGALSNAGNRTSWNAAYDSGDAIHANAAGHTRMKLQAEIDIPELLP